jgi:NTP pyrophosphatase (non-canonical NTP hydrolase)
MGLDLDTLREANIARLPQFKASTGAPAHSEEDGTDWNPYIWFQAVIGEVGEFAQVRLDYDTGAISEVEYREKAAKELADIQCYLDILARRALDNIGHAGDSPAEALLRTVAALGTYANARKKLDRGDYAGRENVYKDEAGESLASAAVELQQLRYLAVNVKDSCVPLQGPEVEWAHPEGVDLSRATIDKFNEVSQRVGSSIHMRLRGRSELEIKI